MLLKTKKKIKKNVKKPISKSIKKDTRHNIFKFSYKGLLKLYR